MPVKTFRPLTPSTRYITYRVDYSEITKTKPEKSLVKPARKPADAIIRPRHRRGIGGGHKQKIRIVDFKRKKHGMEATVTAIEYDPRRTARLALLQYKDGEKTYIIAPVGLQVGAKLMSGPTAPPELGNCLPLQRDSGRSADPQYRNDSWQGGQMVRTAGGAATVDVARRRLRAGSSAFGRNSQDQ